MFAISSGSGHISRLAVVTDNTKDSARRSRDISEGEWFAWKTSDCRLVINEGAVVLYLTSSNLDEPGRMKYL